jgi:hypothetical protein
MTGAYDQAIASGERVLATAGGDVVLYATANLYLGRAYYPSSVSLGKDAVHSCSNAPFPRSEPP